MSAPASPMSSPRTTHVVHDERELSTLLKDMRASSRRCLPIGNGTQIDFGIPLHPETELISLAELSGIRRFAPDDLTCGVGAGTPLTEVLDTVEQEGLTLETGPFQSAAKRTIGGIFGEGAPTPRGFDRGALRSQLIGMTAVDAFGRCFHSGGQVVKNVAGYDLCKLFVGSGGAFFAMTEAQLRLVSLPRAIALCRSERSDRASAAKLWRELRKRIDELRTCDLVLDETGGASVECLLAGTDELVRALSRETGLRTALEGRDAWHSASVDRARDKCYVIRGRAMASEIEDFLAWLPDDANGRIGLQGAFLCGANTRPGPALKGRSFARAIRAKRVADFSSSNSSAIDERIAQAFGGCFAPERASFDTMQQQDRDQR